MPQAAALPPASAVLAAGPPPIIAPAPSLATSPSAAIAPGPGKAVLATRLHSRFVREPAECGYLQDCAELRHCFDPSGLLCEYEETHSTDQRDSSIPPCRSGPGGDDAGATQWDRRRAAECGQICGAAACDDQIADWRDDWRCQHHRSPGAAQPPEKVVHLHCIAHAGVQPRCLWGWAAPNLPGLPSRQRQQASMKTHPWQSQPDVDGILQVC